LGKNRVVLLSRLRRSSSRAAVEQAAVPPDAHSCGPALPQ